MDRGTMTTICSLLFIILAIMFLPVTLLLLSGGALFMVIRKLYFPTFWRIYGHLTVGKVAKNPDAVRIGVLGAANITPIALITPASKQSNVEVVAVAARNFGVAMKYAERHKIRVVHSSYERLIEDPNIDVIYNPLPNGLHCEWTIKALRAGKHVLCEKPLGANQEEAEKMQQVAKETGKILVEAFHYRYHPATKRIVEILKSGEIGEIENIHVRNLVPSFAFKASDIRFNYELGGGTLMDLGCYAVDFIRLVMNEEPTSITSAKATLIKPNVDSRMEASMAFHSGAVASLDVNLRAWKLSQTAKIVGTKGTLEVSGLPLLSFVHSIKVTTRNGSRTEKHYGSGESTYFYQLEDFVKLVRGETPSCITTAEDGVRNMKVVDAIYTKAGLSRR